MQNAAQKILQMIHYSQVKLSTISKLSNSFTHFRHLILYLPYAQSFESIIQIFFAASTIFLFMPRRRSPQQHALQARSKMEAICLIDNQMMRCYFFEIIRDVTTKPKTLFMLNTTISCCKKKNYCIMIYCLVMLKVSRLHIVIKDVKEPRRGFVRK